MWASKFGFSPPPAIDLGVFVGCRTAGDVAAPDAAVLGSGPVTLR